MLVGSAGCLFKPDNVSSDRFVAAVGTARCDPAGFGSFYRGPAPSSHASMLKLAKASKVELRMMRAMRPLSAP